MIHLQKQQLQLRQARRALSSAYATTSGNGGGMAIEQRRNKKRLDFIVTLHYVCFLRLLRQPYVVNLRQERMFIGVIVGAARHLLKLRYFVATGVIGGSVAARTVRFFIGFTYFM